jgi:tRNA-binding protein
MRKKPDISWADFEKIDIRVGTILQASEFPEVRNPAYKLSLDFGELGILASSAQITAHYKPEELIGKQVLAVVNFPAKQIATMISQCLVLGVYNEDQSVTLLATDRQLPNGLHVG